MSLTAEVVGQTAISPVWKATLRRLLSYAAALSPRDEYLCERLERDAVALPMNVVSSEWGRHAGPRGAAGLGGRARRRARAPSCRPGDAVLPADCGRPELQTRAVLTAARGVRSPRPGQHSTRRIADHELLAETLSHYLYRGVTLDGPAAGADATRSLEPARRLPEATWIMVPAGFPHLYTQCAAIWSPIHGKAAAALDRIIVDR